MAAVEEAKKAAQERLEAAQALPAAYLREVFPSSEDELPDGWKWVKLGDIVVENGLVRGPFGGSLKKEIFVSSGYMVYEQSHAISGNLLEGRYFVTESKYKEMERFQIQHSDLLMSCSGTIGKIAVVPKEAPHGIINQALLKVRVDPDICRTEYIKYFLESESFYREVTETSVGTAMVNVSSVGNLKSIPIPLPPLEEQKQIASEVDEKLAGVKLAEASIQQELDTIEAMPAALLRKAFSGGLV
jgi:type I restriction enzyme S subunit